MLETSLASEGAVDESINERLESASHCGAPVVAASNAPIAGARANVRELERKRRRYTLMRGLREWDSGKRGYLLLKRLFDIVFSGLVITLGFIPSVVLCIIICVDSPGFPLYAQKRVGRLGPNGEIREFTMWKFRSMVKDADKMLDTLKEQNEVEGGRSSCDASRAFHPQAFDRRVSPVFKCVSRAVVCGGAAPPVAV